MRPRDKDVYIRVSICEVMDNLHEKNSTLQNYNLLSGRRGTPCLLKSVYLAGFLLHISQAGETPGPHVLPICINHSYDLKVTHADK